MTKWGSFQECKAGSTFENQSPFKQTKKSLMIISINVEKA